MLFADFITHCVATLALGLRPRLRGLQGCGPRGRKPGSQGKGIARLRAKRNEARESRQRHCKVAGQEEGSPGVKAKALQECEPRGSPRVKARGSPGITSHTPMSVRKCEGV